MKRIVLSIIIYVFIIATSCPNGGREECGELWVVRELPDITMTVDDEPLLIDVLAPSHPVFKHSMDRYLTITISVIQGPRIVDIDVLINEVTQQRQIIEIKPFDVGINTISINATDSCGEMDFFVSTTFTVTVTN